MGLFDRFPSTKLNDINLDWILKIISKFKGGNAGQFLRKRSNADFDFYWSDSGGGGGGTSDYDELVNRPQINSVTLAGNQSASDLGLLGTAALEPYRTAANQDTIDAGKQAKITASGMLKGDGDGGVTAATAGTDYLAPAALNSYRTAANQDTIDAAQNTNIASRAKADEVAIVITGSRPSMVVAAGQYVIVRDSSIIGITAGLYTAVNALSPSTDVTAADLSAVSRGGLNSVKIEFSSVAVPLEAKTIAANSYAEWLSVDVSQPGKKPIAIAGINTNRSSALLCGFRLDSTPQTIYVFMRNISNADLLVNSAVIIILYINA